MNNFFKIVLCFYLLLIVSSCSTYHQPEAVTFNKLSPHYISVQKGQIEYYQFGHGSPIVLIPGYVTDVTSWNKDFLTVLSRHHQIIALNNRNVGGSHTSSTLYRGNDLANDTYELIQKLRLKKPAVVGISMGGMIAQQLAILHPDALGHLILINTLIAGDQAVRPSLDVEKKLQGLPNNKFGFYLAAIDLFFPPDWRARMAISLIADRFQPQNYTEINADTVMQQQQRLIKSWLADNAAAKKIKNLHLPVLILNGQADIVIPPENSVILAHVIPHAKLVRWKDGGHGMIYQYPDNIGNVINQFLVY